jgi:hypothetical protein
MSKKIKITNVSHYISKAGKQQCADNIHFIVRGAQLEALYQYNVDNSCILQPNRPSITKQYKEWLELATLEISP